jgi:hypothetical protein
MRFLSSYFIILLQLTILHNIITELTMPDAATIWSYFSADASETPPERRGIPGGFSPIDDLQQPNIQQAAEFAVHTLLSDKASSSEVKPVDYSFVPELRAPDVSDTNWTVVKGYQQVVAGLNYRLIVALHSNKSGSCVGGFAVTIYDHFGELSVTQWGKEVECDTLEHMMKNAKLHEQGPDGPNE